MRNLKILQGFGGDQSNLCDLQVLLNICMQKFTFTKKNISQNNKRFLCILLHESNHNDMLEKLYFTHFVEKRR